MTILVFVRTVKEYEWALRQASKTQAKDICWRILEIGHIHVGSVPSARVPADVPSNCKLLAIEDLEIDSEKIWLDVRALQSELWRTVSNQPKRQLHLVSQWAIAVQLFSAIYLEAVITACFRLVSPDEVRLPPAFSSHLGEEEPLVITDLQAHVYFVARQCQLRCKRHWSHSVKHNSSSLIARGVWIALLGLVMASDLSRAIEWFVKTVRLWLTPGQCQSGLRPSNFPEDSVLLANVDSDLERQFDVSRVSKNLLQKCVALLSNLGRLIAFTDERWKKEILPRYLSGRRKEGDAVAGSNFWKARKLASAVFPTLVFPLALGLRKVWYCTISPSRKPQDISLKLFQLLGSTEMVSERLLNFRRVIYVAKHFALGCDLFRALRPLILVASDSIDTDRALTLAARQCGIRSLATSHGLEIRAEPFFDYYPLADVHCIFSHLSSVIGNVNLPGAGTRRVVCYDSLINRASRGEKVGDSVIGRRVLIVTGGILMYDLFVRQSHYTSSLRTLIERLSKLRPPVEINFKVHPLYDQYDFYYSLQQRFPSIIKRIWRDPLTAQSEIPADIVLLFNYVSTVFFAAASQQIPVVMHFGAFTSLGRRLIKIDGLLGSDNSVRLAAIIDELLSDPTGDLARAARAKTDLVRGKFAQTPVGGFNEAILFTLGQDLAQN